MMTARSLGYLGTLTLAAVIAAGVSVIWRNASTIRDIDRGPAFEDIASQARAVREIRIQRGENNDNHSVTVKHGEDGWRVIDKAGFPAEASMVRQLMVQLADLRLVEAKTRDPSRFDRLNLRDLSDKDSLASRLVLIDGAGEPVLDVLFGKRRDSISGGAPMTYMRRSDGTQSWLVEGELDLRSGPIGWVNQVATDIKRSRVAEGRFYRPDTGTMVIRRVPEVKDKFKIQEVPKERVEKSFYATKNTVGVLDFLVFEDVWPQNKLNFDPAMGWAEIDTTDGLRVIAEFSEDPRAKNRPWTRLRAVALEGASDKVRAEAQAINQRGKGWAYRFGDIKTDRLRATMEALTNARK